MEAIEAIMTRRSIRKFTRKPIPEEVLTVLLEAAMAAPSAGNQQPWEFLVITDRSILDAIPTVHPYAAMVKQAAAAIVVCGNLERENHQGFWVQDCSAATQNLLLAAHAHGLGAVWCGVYPRADRVDGLRKLLKLPESIIPLALVPIGYPNESKGRENRYDSERVHLNHWPVV